MNDHLAMLGKMYEIRFFEEECARLFARGEVRGTTHLGQGQEAVAVGACWDLDADHDTITCTYRGHGATLAKGAPLDRCFGEILGRAEGLCRGKGGSMHLTDLSVGALGEHAIVGAHLPIANGAAFEALYNGTGGAHVCFFGDGSTNIGAFHEALNLAAIWKLPVVFVCENNLYGEYSPIALTTPVTRLADRAGSYAMPGLQVDGNRVTEVREVVGEALSRARAGQGPTLIEALTYRQKGHSRSDPAKYRPPEEVEHWLARDPLKLSEEKLAVDGSTPDQIEELREGAMTRVSEALERALAWPVPDLDSRFEDVWV